MFDKLFEIAEIESSRTNDSFFSTKGRVEYWEKLKKQAEFITHMAAGYPVGFIAFYCNNNSTKESFISLIVVSQEFKGKRIGAALVDSVINISKLRGFTSCSLEVKTDNKLAINLYKSKGFLIAAEEDGKYKMVATL